MGLYINDSPFFHLEIAFLEEERIRFPGCNLNVTGDVNGPTPDVVANRPGDDPIHLGFFALNFDPDW